MIPIGLFDSGVIVWMLSQAQSAKLDHIILRLIEEVEVVRGKDSFQNKPLNIKNGCQLNTYINDLEHNFKKYSMRVRTI